jgi:hypothetical protein
VQSGLHAEVCEIDHKLHAIIAGRKRHVVQSIQEETATNIYFPSPLQGLVGPDVGNLPPPGNPGRHPSNVIWITGEFFGVQRARDMLFSVSVNKVSRLGISLHYPYLTVRYCQSKLVISRDTAILPRKLDWMVTDRAEDLKSTMSDNATFIQFPPIGSSTSLITIYGDHRVSIQRTIRSSMQLVRTMLLSNLWCAES